jgi:integrase
MGHRVRYNLIKKFIEELPAPTAPKKEAYYFDARTRGLCVLVTAGGTKSFYVRRKTNGKSEKFFLGRFPELSIEQARSKAMSFHTEIASGGNPSEDRRADSAELCLGQLFELYLERHARKSRKTFGEMERNFRNWFSGWDGRKLSSISHEDVELFHAGLAKERGPYAANRALELLSAMFNKANLWRIWTKDNPARGVTKFAEHCRERVLREDEIDRFFKALDEEPKDCFYDVIKLLILTGQRKRNVLSMRWQDIDFTARTWVIPGEEMKNGQSLTIALTDTEMSILNRRLEIKGNGYVFPSDGALGYYREPKRRWHRLIRRAQLEDFHIHDLRRTLAAYMANSGANVALIQSALNHKDLQTTLKVYAKTARRAELEARENAHKLMFELAFKDGRAEENEPFLAVTGG